MTAARDIAGITLPFMAGIMLTAYAGSCVTFIIPSAAAISLSASALLTAALLHPNHLNWNATLTRTVISAIFVLCGIFISSSHQMICPLSAHSGSGFFRNAGHMMSEAIDRIGFADKDTNALLNALLTGNRRHLSEEMIHAFRNSGAAHILAISGLHLGIIHSLMTKLLSTAGNSPTAKKARSAICVTLCGAYVLMTGAGASVVRAFIFIVLYETARITGRCKDISCILFSSLLIQLVMNPDSVKDVGFQLSYAAMAGIAFINPILRNFWPQQDKGILKRIWNAASLTISCQVTTCPIAYHYFGTVPKHFLIANLIAMPLIGIIMPVSLLTLALDTAGICPEMLLRATEGLIEILTAALRIISEM